MNEITLLPLQEGVKICAYYYKNLPLTVSLEQVDRAYWSSCGSKVVVEWGNIVRIHVTRQEYEQLNRELAA